MPPVLTCMRMSSALSTCLSPIDAQVPDRNPVCLAALMTLTVNMTSILTQREPWPVNGMVLPPNLQDVRPAPFEFGEDIRQTERPMYYFAYRVLQNLVRKTKAG